MLKSSYEFTVLKMNSENKSYMTMETLLYYLRHLADEN